MDLPALDVEIVGVLVTQFTGGQLVIGRTTGSTTFAGGSGDEWEVDIFDIDWGRARVPGRARVRARRGERQGAAQARGERQLIEFWNEPISFSL